MAMGKDVGKIYPLPPFGTRRARYKRAATRNIRWAIVITSEKVSNKITSRQYTGFEKRQTRGDDDAYNSIGWMYKCGHGVEQNYSLALEWFHKSAECNNSSGWYNLGCMYRDGYGTAQDLQQALYWFKSTAHGQMERRRRDPQTGSPTARLTWRTATVRSR